MNIEDLYARKYDADLYHCVHFVIDAAKLLFNYDYSKNFVLLTDSATHVWPSRKNISTGVKVIRPVEGCIVYMKSLLGETHVGLFVDDGVLHLTKQGVLHQSLRQISVAYKKVKYYVSKH